MTGYTANSHIHSPYSFSAFDGLSQAFEMAISENVRILGINDFYTCAGYDEFNRLASGFGIFPLFNIEFIALDKTMQSFGVRVNDPNNPGRTYISGKGLDFPIPQLPTEDQILGRVIQESQDQVERMTRRTNEILAEIHSSFRLSFTDIKNDLTRGMVRERHIAKAIRIQAEHHYKTAGELAQFYKDLFGGKESIALNSGKAALETEIRNQMLKAGGRAFIPEDDKAFLSIDSAIIQIRKRGGVPCYPVLLDDPKGQFTDFEKDPESLANRLDQLGVHCIELIPGRNDADILSSFVRFFIRKGFLVLFGTEHNTPDLVPLTVTARGNTPLPDDVAKAGMDGAYCIAAHQALRKQGLPSPLESTAPWAKDQIEILVESGQAEVNSFINR